MVSISLGVINLGGLYIFSVNTPRHSEPCQVSIPATTETPKLEESKLEGRISLHEAYIVINISNSILYIYK